MGNGAEEEGSPQSHRGHKGRNPNIVVNFVVNFVGPSAAPATGQEKKETKFTTKLTTMFKDNKDMSKHITLWMLRRYFWPDTRKPLGMRMVTT